MGKLLLKLKNHEIWNYCCGLWHDKRNDEYCPICKKK
jgi:rubrerythrin